MKILNASLLALALALPLSACGERPQANDTSGETTLGQKVREATNDARKKMQEGNISITSDGAKVEIAPNGDLLINNTAVALNDSQRAITQQYRRQMISIAEAGIEIGVQGANLGSRAAGEAIKGLLSGNTDQIEQRVNAEAEKIKASANQLCDQLPALMATQQQLAAAVPEFKPYAKMDQGDIDDCRAGNVQLP
ncbi:MULTISPECIES: DUF2884 family protein [unclassified Stenotrophomonas]|uniref:DUF2884 family protein n=1 Tax=unclassified Stenotrophomonas TaxID=196198 RepID=UPI0025D0FCF6|nr:MULTISPECIES: DUF2884 family protein [unclassified Stenotrophomonas]